MEEIIISGKNLGALALKTFCPRCFWIKMHCSNLPFQIFPGIFSSIDSYSKKVTNVHYDKFLRVPEWLLDLGDFDIPVKTPHFTKFSIVDSGTNVRLRGTPDEIFKRTDGSYFIVDYKTAKYTGTQDELLPMYEIQLNAYAYIGNRLNFSPVSGVGLVYYEPQTDLTRLNMDGNIMDDGFKLPFSSKMLPLRLDPEKLIPSLLQQVRGIVDLNAPPKASNNCKDCNCLNEIIILLKD